VAAGTPTLLILRALGLGDLLTAVPALRALAAAFPDHQRVLAAPPALWPLVARIGPDRDRVPTRRERAVDRLLPAPAWVGPHARPAANAVPALPTGATAVNLHGSGPESHRLLLGTDPARLLAFAHPAVPESSDGPPWASHRTEHETARWTRLLRHYGMPADPDALDLPPPPLPDRLAAVRGATLLHPGAASAARRWPVERWGTVARAEAAQRRAVFVTGSAAERRLAERVAIAARLGRGAVIAGETDLVTLAAVVAVAGRLVCADTGVAHLAAALGTPSVVLFGPTSPAAWGPPASRPRHVVLWQGRTGDPHADHADAGLLAIAPADVIDALAPLPT
jgi:ADP-heptose:LPS heptosyltransferase